MITRPPLHYTTPQQIVTLSNFGFNVPPPVYLYALSQLPSKPVVEYAPIDWHTDDGSAGDTLDAEVKQQVNWDYDMRSDLK